MSQHKFCETVTILIFSTVAFLLELACIAMGVASMSLPWWDTVLNGTFYTSYGLFYYSNAGGQVNTISLVSAGLNGSDAKIINLRRCQIAFQIMGMFFAMLTAFVFLISFIYWICMRRFYPDRLGHHILPRCILVCGIISAFGAFCYFLSFIFFHNFKSEEYMKNVIGTANNITDLAYRFRTTITARYLDSMYFLAWGSFGAELVGSFLFFIVSCSCFGVEECGRYIYYKRLKNEGASRYNQTGEFGSQVYGTNVSKKPIFEYESPIFTSGGNQGMINVPHFNSGDLYGTRRTEPTGVYYASADPNYNTNTGISNPIQLDSPGTGVGAPMRRLSTDKSGLIVPIYSDRS